MEDNTIELIS